VSRSAFAGGFAFPPDVVQELIDDARGGLEQTVREAEAAGAKQVSGKLLTGIPWGEIVTLLEQQAFDLCVIGTQGRTGLSRILLGSVAEKVMRHSPCPVLTVRPDAPAKPFTHVLIPTDFSVGAQRALDVVADVVGPGSSITLVHVLELPVLLSGELKAPGLARDLDARTMAALDEMVAQLVQKTDASVEVRTRLGYPATQILCALDEDPTIDLVVMGSHGRSGIGRALIGSVSEKVVRHARCPVLVARTSRPQ
jgi:nucleotide-binding universal stress UspA family protein